MTDASPYPALARLSIAAHLEDKPLPDSTVLRGLSRDDSIWREEKGCFVSLKNKDGSLRGCIGTFLPTKATVAEEIMANAIAAATRDPRFPPVKAEELPDLRISVDLLSTPENVTPGMTLDPQMYGVIVSKDGRRGLLLPDLEGVDTVEKQLGIAAQKAGIRDMHDIQVQRFTVSRFKENG